MTEIKGEAEPIRPSRFCAQIYPQVISSRAELPNLGLDSLGLPAMNGDVLRDFGSKAWGTPPGQTGGVYPFLGLEDLNSAPKTPPHRLNIGSRGARWG